MKRVLLITDNDELLSRFIELVKELSLSKDYDFNYAFSPNNKALCEKYKDANWIQSLKVKDKVPSLISEYEIVISLHCKQLFPSELVKGVRCINVHPGLNPHNRGWFPQVFSIINGLPCGATIHEIDDELDHGAIICQQEVKIEQHDTSITVYNKVLDVEISLLRKNLKSILKGEYETFTTEEGNLNLKKDFDALCMLNLNDVDTFQNHLNKLRALTHGNYSNAFFINDKGEKVYVKIELSPTLS